jgi:fatty-acyl-CoA synthase
VPDGHVGDQVMAALVLNAGQTLDPDEFEAFLAGQPDLSPKAWPRYVRIATELPSTATHKVLKRQLIAQATAIGADETLWVREPRGTAYRDAASSLVPGGGSAPSPVAPA